MWLCTCAGASLWKSLKQKKCKIQLKSNDHHCPPNLCACWQISCWGWGNPYVLGQISHFDLAAQSAYFGFLPATGQERQQIWGGLGSKYELGCATNMARVEALMCWMEFSIQASGTFQSADRSSIAMELLPRDLQRWYRFLSFLASLGPILFSHWLNVFRLLI